MIKRIKVKLMPTEDQARQMFKTVKAAESVYDWALKKQQESLKSTGHLIKNNELRKELTVLKRDEMSFLQEVSANVSKQAVKDLCYAYSKFRKGLAEEPKSMKDMKKIPSFYNDTQKMKVRERDILIEKVGWVDLFDRGSVKVDGRHTNPRISFEDNCWYLSVGVEIKEKE